MIVVYGLCFAINSFHRDLFVIIGTLPAYTVSQIKSLYLDETALQVFDAIPIGVGLWSRIRAKRFGLERLSK